MRPDAVISAFYKIAASSELEADREIIRRKGLWEFAKAAWPEVEADPLVPSWHMEQICTHLEAVTRGDCRRLIINVPPGCTKSTLVSVLWPAWEWILTPSQKWMFATFDDSLAWRDALRCRKLIRSEWFAQRWGSTVAIDESGESQATQSIYHTTAGGRRVSVTVGGKAIGWHARRQVIDDPIKTKDVLGDPKATAEALERAWKWYTVTMASRRNDPKTFSRVIIMQRLHEADLVGRIVESDTEREYVHLMLPMRFEPERACKTPYGGDIRTEPGELLVPDRYDETAVKELERDMGSQAAAAQLQQRPAPAGGNIFQREWFAERWTVLPADLHLLIQSWDTTFKDKATADYVAGHVWGFCRGKFYLLDRLHDRMGLPDVIRAVKAFARRWPKARGKLIEDKANGPAIEQTLRDELPGIIMVTPEGGKVARANAISPLAEARNIVLPDPTAELKLANGTVLTYEWIDAMVEEIVTFPFARHDDDVDAMTQGIIHLHDSGQPRYLDAMRKIATGKVRFSAH